MSKYMILFKANPSAWPSDPKQVLAIWEGAMAGTERLLKEGQLKEVGWFTNSEGYAIVESESKDKVLEIVNHFFPFFSQEIHEIVPWDRAKEALLSSARMNASDS
jgi:hypothetical protein